MPDRLPHVAGRAMTVKAISAALEDAGLCLVTGPAGIGKTTVATAAARATGREVWTGGGLPSLVDRPGTALARAVRVPVPSHVEDAVTLVTALVRDGVLLLDEVHWADPHSVRVATAAAGRVRTVFCLTDGGRPREETRRGVEALRSAACTVVELAPLSDEAVAEIVRGADPAAAESDVARVVLAARGNPSAALALVTGGSVMARRSLAVRAQALTVAGRTALVVLGLRGRPTRAHSLGPGGAELLEHGLVVPVGEAADPVLGFPAAATYALAGSLASPAALVDLHRHLATVSRDPWDRVHHLAASGDRDGAAEEALRAAPALGAADRARLLERAAELSRGDRRRRLWGAAAEAADAAGDGDTAARARRRAVTAHLTGRESEVMRLIATGLTTAAVARRLQISAETVETHVRSAVSKMGGRNRTEAAVLLSASEAR